MAVTVKFVGALRHFLGTGELTLGCKACLSIGELINEIKKEVPELKRNLIDQQLDDPRSNTLVLVNSMEISVLDGLETRLKDGDEIVLVPVVHGG
jgi:molybdopterin synthase sulfur carrier subunit